MFNRPPLIPIYGDITILRRMLLAVQVRLSQIVNLTGKSFMRAFIVFTQRFNLYMICYLWVLIYKRSIYLTSYVTILKVKRKVQMRKNLSIKCSKGVDTWQNN